MHHPRHTFPMSLAGETTLTVHCPLPDPTSEAAPQFFRWIPSLPFPPNQINTIISLNLSLESSSPPLPSPIAQPRSASSPAFSPPTPPCRSLARASVSSTARASAGALPTAGPAAPHHHRHCHRRHWVSLPFAPRPIDLGVLVVAGLVFKKG
jgi:hypothetical protein